MENNDLSALAPLLSKLIADLTEPIRDTQMELDARLAAQDLILKKVVSEAFMDDPALLPPFVQELQTWTGAKFANGLPQDEYAIELRARIATHMQRFGEAVSRLVQKGRQQDQ